MHPNQEQSRSAFPTWTELEDMIQQSRYSQLMAAQRHSQNFTFRRITSHPSEASTGERETPHSPEKNCRLYYIGQDGGFSNKSTLLYRDLYAPVSDPKSPYVPPPLLSAEELAARHLSPNYNQHSNYQPPECLLQLKAVDTPSSPLSKEETLLRERKRMGIIGITSYDLHPDGRLVYPAGGKLYSVVDDFSARHYTPTELPSPPSSACLDPKICPSRSDLVACVNASDIWVVTASGDKGVPPEGHVCRLTSVHKSTGKLEDDFLSAGSPSFVIQEEFDRFTGFWWQPLQSQASTGGPSTYRILYEETDESQVQIHTLTTSNGDLETYRYPRAGTPNAKSTLKIVEFTYSPAVSGTSTSQFSNVKHYVLPVPLDQAFPNSSEYLVRAGWLPDGSAVWTQISDREQHRMTFVVIPLATFVLAPETASPPTSTSPSASPPAASTPSDHPYLAFYEVRNDMWIDAHDGIYMLKKPYLKEPLAEGERALQMLYVRASEEGDRNRHLFLVSTVLDYQKRSTRALSAVQLTCGTWDVYLKSSFWVDEEHSLVYFEANCDSPLDRQLYAVSFAGAGTANDAATNGFPRAPICLTDTKATNAFVIAAHVSAESSVFVRSVSSPNRLTTTGVYHIPASLWEAAVKVPEPKACASSDTSSAHMSPAPSPKGAEQLSELSPMDTELAASEPLRPAIRPVRAVRVPQCELLDPTTAFKRTTPELQCHEIAQLTLGSSRINDEPNPEYFVYYARPEPLAPTILGNDKRGTPLYGMFFKPDNFVDPTPTNTGATGSEGENGHNQEHKYPVLIHVYAGPQIQLVSKAYSPIGMSRLRPLLKRGYCIMILDPRGSSGRGLEFERCLKYALGELEITDQTNCVLELADSIYPFIDKSRIGIYGWSYGGYASLLALAKRPRTIKVACACAPVSAWELYDTGYTERYLGLPEEHKEEYNRSNVLNWVAGEQLTPLSLQRGPYMINVGFPRESSRLLLVHGLLDENVHAFHTAELLKALVQNNVPYQLLLYPDQRHGLRSHESANHFEISLLDFIFRNL